jgi:hypothetical protein
MRVDEEIWLVCMRVQDMGCDPAEGSIAMNCDLCNAEIWVARSSQIMLASGEPYRRICLNCASERADFKKPESTAEEIARLRAQAEEAFDKMNNLHDEGEIRRQFELANDSLDSAASLAREGGLDETAKELDERALHIRRVYRHQFMNPPDLTP